MRVVVLAVVVAIGCALMAALAGRRRERRTQPQDLARWALAKGWVFEHLASRDPALSGFEAFGVGHRGQGLCTVRGSLTIAARTYGLVCGDYEVRVMSARGTRPVEDRHVFSYLYLRLPVRTPDLAVHRAGLLDKVSQAAGFGDVEIASEQFERAFSVKCADPRFANEVMTPEIMAFLLQQNPEKVELRDGCLCFIDERATWSPTDFERVIALAEGFLSRWPATAFSFSGGSGGAGT